MAKATTWMSHAGQFLLGLVLSAVFAGAGAALWLGVGIFLFFAASGDARIGAAVVVVPLLLGVTYWAVRRRWARALGALAFYALVLPGAYLYYIHGEANQDALEREAMKNEYSQRTIAPPLGTVDVLGFALVRSRCITLCAGILLNGIAKEVAGISYDDTVNFETGLGYGKEGSPWIFRRFRLGRGDECLAGPERGASGSSLSYTGADVQWIQSSGIFDVCIVGSVGRAELGTMILVEGHDPSLHNDRMRRPHGPVGGAMVASRIADGQRSEITRWEFGTYPRSHKNVGTPFTTLDFIRTLTGEGATDRLANPYATTFREAVERIHRHLAVMPNFDGRAPFEFLRNVHEHEQGSRQRRSTIDSDVAAQLKESAGVICRDRSRELSTGICTEHYNSVVKAIFTPDIADALLLAQ
jgi:hypothetical protein